MKTCFYCNRNILTGARIILDGIQYVCKEEADLVICNDIRTKQEMNRKLTEFNTKQDQIRENGGTKIECSCGKTFYTLFPIETMPPCDDCPYCHKTYFEKEEE
jgi:hypothetical protein